VKAGTFVTRDGCRLPYWLRGNGPLVTLTPGGREPGESVAALADVLAEHATVLTWDRRAEFFSTMVYPPYFFFVSLSTICSPA
jgi:hypothetical protein